MNGVPNYQHYRTFDMWQIVRFDPGDVAGKLVGKGFTYRNAKEFVWLLDFQHTAKGSGTRFFYELMITANWRAA